MNPANRTPLTALALLALAGLAPQAARADDVTRIVNYQPWDYAIGWSNGRVAAYPDNVTIPGGFRVDVLNPQSANAINSAGVITFANPNAQLSIFAPSNLGTLVYYSTGSVFSSYANSNTSGIWVTGGISTRFRVRNGSTMTTTAGAYSTVNGGQLIMQGDGLSRFTNYYTSTFDVTGELTLDNLPFYNGFGANLRLTSPAVIDSLIASNPLVNNGILSVAAGASGGCSISPNVAFDNQSVVVVNSSLLHIQNCANVQGQTLASGGWNISGSGLLYFNNLQNLSTIGNSAQVLLSGDSADISQLHSVSENFGHLQLYGRSHEATPPGATYYNYGTLELDRTSRFRAHQSFYNMPGGRLRIETNGPGDGGLIIADDVAALYGELELEFSPSYTPHCGDVINIMSGQRLYDFSSAIYTNKFLPSNITLNIRQQFGTLSVVVGSSADFDHDGTVDFFDYDAFVVCFEDPDCLTADFDADGTIDFFDYDAFVAAFEAGC